MHFSTTFLVAFSALAVAQQSSQAVVRTRETLIDSRENMYANRCPLQDNPATGYLAQTNGDGAVTGQPQPATSQEAAATSQEAPVTSQQPAATIAASGSTGLVPTQTDQSSTLATSAQESNHASTSGSPTSISTSIESSHRPSSTDDLDSSSSHLGSTGAAAVQTAGPVGLSVGLAGVALAAFL